MLRKNSNPQGTSVRSGEMSEVSVGPLGYPPKQVLWCGEHLVRGRTEGHHFGVAVFPSILDQELSHRMTVAVTTHKGSRSRLDVFEDNERLLIDSELDDDGLWDTRVKHHSVTPDKCHRPDILGRVLEVISYCLMGKNP